MPDRTTATKRAPMNSPRKTALVAGVFYLLTFVSIPTLALYGPVQDPNYIVGPGPDTPVLILWGGCPPTHQSTASWFNTRCPITWTSTACSRRSHPARTSVSRADHSWP